MEGDVIYADPQRKGVGSGQDGSPPGLILPIMTLPDHYDKFSEFMLFELQ